MVFFCSWLNLLVLRGGYLEFLAKLNEVGLFVTKEPDGRWCLNTDIRGLECDLSQRRFSLFSLILG